MKPLRTVVAVVSRVSRSSRRTRHDPGRNLLHRQLTSEPTMRETHETVLRHPITLERT